MTPEERLRKIEDHLLVTAEMMRASDRRWERRFEEHDARFARVEGVVRSLAGSHKKLFRAVEKLVEAHEETETRLEAVSDRLEAVTEKLEELADGQRVTRAMLDALTHNIDRFVRGQGGNGGRTKGGRH